MFEGPIGKQMMIEQGYVPATCTMGEQIAGPLIYSEVSRGADPCGGCNMDRSVCHGRPKLPTDQWGRLIHPLEPSQFEKDLVRLFKPVKKEPIEGWDVPFTKEPSENK